MQVLPSHTQRQLVSGRIGWGWRQATYPISVNFIFAGFSILAIAIARLLTKGELDLLAITSIVLVFGLIIGIYTAKSVVEVCRQNSNYLFSRSQLLGIAVYWLVLIAVLGGSPETSKLFVAIWWVLPAAIFTGIAASLSLQSSRSKSPTDRKQPLEKFNAEPLNVVTYSDRTVLVSPSAVGQQPRQFNSLVLIVFGLFCWTMLDLSSNLRAIAAIVLTASGLTGFFTWQAQLHSPEKILQLKFAGLWGIAAEYLIDITSFSMLSIVKLQEAGGELSWMQLTGNNRDITIPLVMTNLPSPTEKDVDRNDQLDKTLRDEFHLAKQETERDSLGLANVLLPQGAGILAGTAFILVGVLLLLIFSLPSKLTSESAIAWLGVCLVSPAIARFFLQLVAPNSLQSDRLYPNSRLHSWEIGTAMLLVSAFLSSQAMGKVLSLGVLQQSLPLINLICGWLCISVGICLLAFVRRTPLWHNN
ncbi:MULTISPECIES: hypothetical protein [Pseudanabaena]|uniref:Uncharacterized protein n=2 Tax=Pseudanabaena TaxID=1152 RepID=L8N2P6_9CYAN|nr:MULTISPECIES: hypothetical protein [Pseudanabaena]ELS33314.1 hypothetical protein Pse7429DRAFT_1550 [Pseudanabaena biceps PCC 7429]MDG3494453.1 hypothetical protein [Pseudanabaena catenata USMAC16]